MNVIQQTQRWRLRREHPELVVVAKIQLGVCLVALVIWAALRPTDAVPRSEASAFVGLLVVGAAVGAGLWWYVGRGPIGDEPPPLPDNIAQVVSRAVRRQWLYGVVMLGLGILGLVLGGTVNAVNLIWAIPLVILGLIWILLLSIVVRGAMKKFNDRENLRP